MIDERLIIDHLKNWKASLGKTFQDDVISIVLDIILKKVESFDCDEKLKELEDLEEQGLLLRLPYNLATCGKLYYVDERDSEIYELTADKITISKAMITNEFVYEVDSLEFRFEDFGKIVFKTKSEAEKALAEMRE